MKRPSHDHIMDATEALAKASEAEREAGNDREATALNELSLSLFKFVLTVEET